MKKIRKILACGHGDLNKGTDLVDLISFKINVIIKRLIELENIVKRIYKQKIHINDHMRMLKNVKCYKNSEIYLKMFVENNKNTFVIAKM